LKESVPEGVLLVRNELKDHTRKETMDTRTSVFHAVTGEFLGKFDFLTEMGDFLRANEMMIVGFNAFGALVRSVHTPWDIS
jgi:hypothetical protein